MKITFVFLLAGWPTGSKLWLWIYVDWWQSGEKGKREREREKLKGQSCIFENWNCCSTTKLAQLSETLSTNGSVHATVAPINICTIYVETNQSCRQCREKSITVLPDSLLDTIKKLICFMFHNPIVIKLTAFIHNKRTLRVMYYYGS